MSFLRLAIVAVLLCGTGVVALAKSPRLQAPAVARQGDPPQARSASPDMPLLPLTAMSTDRGPAPRPPNPKRAPKPPPPASGGAAPVAVPPRSASRGAAAARDRRAREPRQEIALPFEGSLETILYSADRRLAIVDGRIVQVGDLVRGARITDITERTVLLRDADNRLRTLALGDNR